MKERKNGVVVRVKVCVKERERERERVEQINSERFVDKTSLLSTSDCGSSQDKKSFLSLNFS